MNIGILINSIRAILLAVGLCVSPMTVATQDVEDPQDVIAYLRWVLVEPDIYDEILRLSEAGCVWKNQVFWSGSPTEKNLRTKVFWMNFSAQFSTSSNSTFWVTYAFSYKDGKILEIINTTKQSKIKKCSS